MQTPENYVNERLDHLGLVAGVCEEIGLAAYLDRLAGETKHQVSMGTATVAMILHGFGFSNRRLYLVPQFFANKPVEHLLGPGIEAADLNDDCLDRTLDWLYAPDPTQLFAGIATQARKIFGVSARHVHVDTTSFSVSGAYAASEQEESEASLIVADSGIYSEANRRRFNAAKIRWISRVPETSTEAKAVVETASDSREWQDSEDGQTHWFTRTMSLPQGQERLSSLCAQSREKHERRRHSSGKWRKPSTVGNKSSGTCPTSALDVAPMPRARWRAN